MLTMEGLTPTWFASNATHPIVRLADSLDCVAPPCGSAVRRVVPPCQTIGQTHTRAGSNGKSRLKILARYSILLRIFALLITFLETDLIHVNKSALP